ncbi:unnamed protein product [Lepeophtheirus salmonis]|uniref:(salmon louse) hypothetical protein n=1 Tax=Lepeophtheirus salmonis TaxID=72036 RepID=A0A7R8CFL7_LEPSM|nr:unnamed protein product [Lepeophtheirus salmonis]CAF2803486.1 unnamed protein product [Lepeophtheirus salmonis]
MNHFKRENFHVEVFEKAPLGIFLIKDATVGEDDGSSTVEMEVFMTSFAAVLISAKFLVKTDEQHNSDTVSRDSGSRYHNRKKSAEFMAMIKEEIVKDPTTSMRKMAKEMEIDLLKASNEDLNLKSFVWTPR